MVLLPPLRERPAEISHLATYFLKQACEKLKRAPLRLSETTLRALLLHPFPGNVRELRNLMDYCAATVSDNEVRPEHVRRGFYTPQPLQVKCRHPAARQVRAHRRQLPARSDFVAWPTKSRNWKPGGCVRHSIQLGEISDGQRSQLECRCALS